MLSVHSTRFSRWGNGIDIASRLRRVLERYRERGSRILRTDQLGAIRLLTDGQRCWITHYVEEW